MSRWFRWYAGTSEDGKFRLVARNANVTVATVIGVWAALLEDASHADHRGVVTRNEDYLSAVLDLDDGVAEAILSAMEVADMISVGMGAITIVHWKERQFETDAKDGTNAERQRRYRQRKKMDFPPDQSSSVTEQRNGTVTAGKRPDTDTDTDTDTEKETEQSSHTELEAAREGEVAVGHGVFVNCETIRHRAFTISIPALELGTGGRYSRDELKTKAQAHALQWAAEIEAGKRPDQVLPGKIANFLNATIMGEFNRQQCADVRKERAKTTPTVTNGAVTNHVQKLLAERGAWKSGASA